ncbi:hypothetical protein KY290_030600 [Solanum tuberosum]|uniref:NB-ARC domain containing protein n=1 Tax=Solanum tuberosum TaxID=4113 RepID=A0ABQ7U8L5_SOLTU|nr:hypothetical protein KY290_030600 [Solanum tuberosum]
MQQVDVSGIGNFNLESLNEVPQHVEKSVHHAKEIVVSTALNTSEDVDDSLAIMLDKDLNKERGTCSKENWNMVIHRKASSNVSPGSRSNSSNDLLCSNSFDDFLKDTVKDGNVIAPTLHISNPEVNKIIQECEATMALKSNLAIKPPIVTLNTLAHEVLTQSLESFRELQGESGQLILSKGNDKDLVKGMSSLSQANLTNNLIISKENQGERSAPRWADLVDEEVQVSPPILNGKLSPQALEFVPKSVIAKKNEVEALASGVNPTNSYAIDLGDDSFDEDEEDNILDECFDKVARDGDISPRHQRSGSNKRKGRHMVGNTVGMVK